ncbi:TRMT61A (predicted) [Pycnogonum litorale]
MSKKKSGWEKLKTAEEKRKREEALLKQTPRLFTYFSSKQPQPDLSDTDPVVPNKSGGRFCSFSPCIEQVQKTCTALLEHGFNDVNTMECLVSGYEVKNYYFPPINWNKSKKKESSEDASSTSQVDDGKTNATDGITAVTVPPLKKTGHTGYLTFATLPPS